MNTVTSLGQLELNAWYTIVVSIEGGNATLSVNGQVPAVARPPFTILNVRSNLWLGGYNNFVNISSLTGTSQGFNGSVSLLEINGRTVDLILDADFGYGVTQSETSTCAGNPCFNGGQCIENGPSFVCECSGGYTGLLCGSLLDPCVLGATLCASGSTCQANSNGVNFTCLCPFRRGGDFCDQGEFKQYIYLEHNQTICLIEYYISVYLHLMIVFVLAMIGYFSLLADVEITTPSFNVISYLEYAFQFSNPRQTSLEITFNPSSSHGLLLHFGDHTQLRDFLSLTLINSRVQFRYDLGSGVAILTSSPLSLNTWHTIYATRDGRTGTLTVDNGAVITAVSPGGLQELPPIGNIRLGGLGDTSILSPHIGTEIGYQGCIQSLQVIHMHLI